MGILPLKKCLNATIAVSRQNSVCLGSSLSMRSFAIEDPGSPVPPLYATLVMSYGYVISFSIVLSLLESIENMQSIIHAMKKKNKQKNCIPCTAFNIFENCLFFYGIHIHR